MFFHRLRFGKTKMAAHAAHFDFNMPQHPIYMKEVPLFPIRKSGASSLIILFGLQLHHALIDHQLHSACNGNAAMDIGQRAL